MPDAAGNFKGISVPAEAWERVFGRPNPPKLNGMKAALERGCTCRWWGRGCILEFDDNCPVLHRHYR